MYEIRRYRIYFGRDGMKIVVLLCGGDKRNQSADISRAVKLWAEFGKRRKQDEKE